MITGPVMPITMVQVVIVRKDGDKENLKSIDIPIRDDRKMTLELDTNEWGVELNLAVPISDNYSVTYVMRDQEAMVDGKLPPYTDGIYSDSDVARQLTTQRLHYEREIEKLEAKLKRRDKTLRKLRSEKAERRRLQI